MLFIHHAWKPAHPSIPETMCNQPKPGLETFLTGQHHPIALCQTRYPRSQKRDVQIYVQIIHWTIEKQHATSQSLRVQQLTFHLPQGLRSSTVLVVDTKSLDLLMKNWPSRLAHDAPPELPRKLSDATPGPEGFLAKLCEAVAMPCHGFYTWVPQCLSRVYPQMTPKPSQNGHSGEPNGNFMDGLMFGS